MALKRRNHDRTINANRNVSRQHNCISLGLPSPAQLNQPLPQDNENPGDESLA